MKKLKKGFSLAELLIAMGIIAVIATMGFSISRKGIENAYNAYFYTGYKGIYDAIAETNSQGIDETVVEGEGLWRLLRLNEEYVNNIASLLNASNNVVHRNDGHSIITAPNGISYEISLNNNFGDIWIDGTGYRYLDIIMRVPQVRRADNQGQGQAELYYLWGFQGGLIIPVTRDNNTVDLQNRKDLLPTFGNDGISGKIIVPVPVDGRGQGEPSFTRRNFYSFREAFCRRYNTNARLGVNGDTVINCGAHVNARGVNVEAVDNDGETVEGFLQVENPKKIF